MALVYLTVAMVALVAFVSLGVDYGRVQLVRGELQLAADAAARHAAAGLAAGITAAENNAVSAAGDNKADGTEVVLDRAVDVEFGRWDPSTQAFIVLTGAARSGADAIRVTARRTSARGNPVPLLFARVIGRASFDVNATSVARYRPDSSFDGFVGLNGITMHNNTFFGSYNSAVTTTPTEETASGLGSLYSNGAISSGNGSRLKGDAVLGPTAPAIVGPVVTGSTTRMPTTLAAPPEAIWAPAPNPNGLPQNYTAGNVTLPGGTYWFTSLTVNGTLSFSGPATVTVNGPIEINGALLAFALVPENLLVYQIGTHTLGDSDNNGNNVNIVADISAPSSDFVIRNNLYFRGRMIARSIEIKNNADIFYDAALGSASNGSKVVTVR